MGWLVASPVTLRLSCKPPQSLPSFLARLQKSLFLPKKRVGFFPHKDGTGSHSEGMVLPDVLVAVHVHGVELLHLLLARVLLHVLQHLIGHVLGQDGEHQPLLGNGAGKGVCHHAKPGPCQAQQCTVQMHSLNAWYKYTMQLHGLNAWCMHYGPSAPLSMGTESSKVTFPSLRALRWWSWLSPKDPRAQPGL